MTRISMTIATAALTLSLAPAAQAYGVAEDAIAKGASPQTQIAGICPLDVTPLLVTALNLPPAAESTLTIKVACNG